MIQDRAIVNLRPTWSPTWSVDWCNF